MMNCMHKDTLNNVFLNKTTRETLSSKHDVRAMRSIHLQLTRVTNWQHRRIQFVAHVVICQHLQADFHRFVHIQQRILQQRHLDPTARRNASVVFARGFAQTYRATVATNVPRSLGSNPQKQQVGGWNKKVAIVMMWLNFGWNSQCDHVRQQNVNGFGFKQN